MIYKTLAQTEEMNNSFCVYVGYQELSQSRHACTMEQLNLAGANIAVLQE